MSFNLGFQLKVEYECLSCSSNCLGENTQNAGNLTQDRLLAAGSQHCWIPLSQYLLLDMLPYILMGHIPILKKIACVFGKNLNEFSCCTIFSRWIQCIFSKHHDFHLMLSLMVKGHYLAFAFARSYLLGLLF